MFIDWYGLSDSGTVKDVNQDTILCDLQSNETRDIGIFAVADGVGGLECGDIASAVAINTLKEWWDSAISQSLPEDILSETFVSNIHQINDEIARYQYHMATTLSSLLVLHDRYYILHIGDSRVYHYRKGLTEQFTQLTPDHSSIVTTVNANGELIQMGVLTDCLGKMSKEGYYTSSGEFRPNDIFFLCSDGVYKTQPTKILKQILSHSKKHPADICRLMINGAKFNGETDNISAIAVRLTKKPVRK